MRGTIINIHGPSGIGKTSLLQLVNSIYLPANTMLNFSGTNISILIYCEKTSGITLVIDDKQSSFDKSKITTLIYSLAEGRTRLKATKESDLMPYKKFEVNVLASAEEELNDKVRTHTGASRRTLEVYTNKIYSSAEKSDRAHEVSEKVYGLAGNVFINKLIERYSENEYKEIINKYEEMKRILKKKAQEGTVNTYIQNLAVIVVADILMNQFFEFGYDEQSSIEMGIKILGMLELEKEIDEVEKAKEILQDWIISNDFKFDRHCFTDEYKNLENVRLACEIIEGKDNVEKYGLYDNGVYYILPLKFNEILCKYEMNPNKIRKGFAEKGYILIDEVNNRFLVPKFYNGSTRRMVAFKMENSKKRPINEFGEEVVKNKTCSSFDKEDLLKLEDKLKEEMSVVLDEELKEILNKERNDEYE